MFRDDLTLPGLMQLKAKAPDGDVYNKIQANWDGISKPIDGLGDFEKVICRIGAIQGSVVPRLESRVAVIMCADNGIVDEGVSQVGKEVTLQVARMLGQGISTANTLAASSGVKVLPVDIGIDYAGEIEGVRAAKVRPGTRDFLKEPSMTEKEALCAIGTGIDIARELAEEGVDILLAGEMGIGNTTTAAAMLALLTGREAEGLVGRGAGLDDAGLSRKLEVVRTAALKYAAEGALDDASEDAQEDAPYDAEISAPKAFEYLCRVGGLDIAALCGLFIGGSLHGVPVVVDGVITAVAAMLADIFVPGTRDSMIAAHAGREKGLETALSVLGLKPLMNGNMALGEGTGAIMLMPLLDVALNFYRSASTFGDGGIEEYRRYK